MWLRTRPRKKLGFINPLFFRLENQKKIRVCRTTFLPPSKLLLRGQIKRLLGLLLAPPDFRTFIRSYTLSYARTTLLLDSVKHFPSCLSVCIDTLEAFALRQCLIFLVVSLSNFWKTQKWIDQKKNVWENSNAYHSGQWFLLFNFGTLTNFPS